MRTLLTALCSTGLLSALSIACGSSSPGRPPNIVLIVADDLGWRDTGAYGSRFYRTPHIDGLAREGVRFTNAYAASPVCSPTRAAILTGLEPARLRLTSPVGHHAEEVQDPRMPRTASPTLRAIPAPSRTRLPLEYVTVAETLLNAGYRTAFFGKWHLGYGRHLPDQQGFEVALAGQSLPFPPSYFSPYGIPEFEDGPMGEHLDERFASKAVEFMRTHRSEPFFVSLWPFSVHVPLQARPALVETYRGSARPEDPQRNPEMGAMVETLDGCVGIVLDALDDLGLRQETIVLFTSDNGGMHVSMSESEGEPPVTSNHPLRGGKGQLYEGGVRVPLIVRWPDEIDAGAVSQEFITSTDLHPTLLDLARVSPSTEPALDGVSFVGALRGRPSPREAVFAHLPVYMPRRLGTPSTSVRKGDWKLIRFYADTEAQVDRFELYNLADDLAEERDLAARLPVIRSELNDLIDEYLASTSALVPVPNPIYQRREEP